MRICYDEESFDIVQGGLWFSVRMLPFPSLFSHLIVQGNNFRNTNICTGKVLDICWPAFSPTLISASTDTSGMFIFKTQKGIASSVGFEYVVELPISCNKSYLVNWGSVVICWVFRAGMAHELNLEVCLSFLLWYTWFPWVGIARF